MVLNTHRLEKDRETNKCVQWFSENFLWMWHGTDFSKVKMVYTLENEHGTRKSPLCKGTSSEWKTFMTLGSMLIFHGWICKIFLLVGSWWRFAHETYVQGRRCHRATTQSKAKLSKVWTCPIHGWALRFGTFCTEMPTNGAGLFTKQNWIFKREGKCR